MTSSDRASWFLVTFAALVATVFSSSRALAQDPRMPGPLEEFVQTREYPRPGASGPNRGEDVPFAETLGRIDPPLLVRSDPRLRRAHAGRAAAAAWLR